MSKMIEISDEAYEALCRRAKVAGLTPGELVARELAPMPEQVPWDVMLERIRSRKRIDMSNEEIVSLIHEGREERDRELDDRD